MLSVPTGGCPRCATLDPMNDHRARSARLSLALGAILALLLAVAVTPPGARAADPTAVPGPSVSPGPTVAADSPWHHLDAAGEPVVDLWFGWSSTCPHCARARAWLADFAPTAPWLQVHSLQVDGESGRANADELLALAATIDAEIGGVPAFLYAGRAEVGFDVATTTGAQLERDLLAYRDSLVAASAPSPSPSAEPGGSPAPAAAAAIALPIVGTVDAATLSLPVLAVVLGGLDAVNPCALAILLFLVSALVGARDRRRIVIVGGAFIAATAVVYFLLMAAWLNAFLLVRRAARRDRHRRRCGPRGRPHQRQGLRLVPAWPVARHPRVGAAFDLRTHPGGLRDGRHARPRSARPSWSPRPPPPTRCSARAASRSSSRAS